MAKENLRKLDKNGKQSRPILDDITVVIPTLGRPILEECINSIKEGNHWPAEIIVVDQSSGPEVKALLENLKTTGIKILHIQSQQRGRSSALNRGFETFKTSFVAVTDDDCLVGVDWLEKITDRLLENPCSIITGRIDPAGEQVAIVVTSQEPAIYQRPRLKFDSMSGGNMGTSMEVIKLVGLFDEDKRLRYAEDAEWAYRALRAGATIMYEPKAKVQHYGWRDERQRIAQYRNYAHSSGAFYGKYLRRGDWFIALRAIIHYFRAIRRWLKGIIIGDQETQLLGKSYVMGLLPGIIAGFRRDKNQQI